MDNPNKHLLAKIGQYVLIANKNNRILLLERQRSKEWSLPGGRLNKNDKDWKAALVREVREETGLNITELNPFAIKLIEDPYQIKYCVYFTAKYSTANNLKISQEHSSYKWVNLEDMSQMKFDDEPKVRQVLEQYSAERLHKK